ncbi:MAG: hypothetical protein HY000_07045 [Planctomycetes bacterium]|nr:hypothetical protein [Planctomycetota bacterium]
MSTPADSAPCTVPAHFRCHAGVARADITPPVGIYARSWGAATHDQAEGIHRPLVATALVLAHVTEQTGPCAILSVDLGWWNDRRQADRLLASVCDATGLPTSHLLLALSHTHSGPTLNPSVADRPGGEHIAPYLDRLRETLTALIQRARSKLKPAWITFASGSCGLAVNRDFHAPDG